MCTFHDRVRCAFPGQIASVLISSSDRVPLYVAAIVSEPMRLNWTGALEETEMVMYDTVGKLFKQTGYAPEDVSFPSLMSDCSARVKL